MRDRLLHKTLKHFGIWSLVLILGVTVTSFAGLGPPHVGFWIDDKTYKTIGTPTDLPDKGPTDGLYILNGLDGQLPVGEAKPGDKDFNGGRWEVTVLAFTEQGIAYHDADNDGVIDSPLTNWEDVEANIASGYLKVVGPGPRFECPVIKKK